MEFTPEAAIPVVKGLKRSEELLKDICKTVGHNWTRSYPNGISSSTISGSVIYRHCKRCSEVELV